MIALFKCHFRYILSRATRKILTALLLAFLLFSVIVAINSKHHYYTYEYFFNTCFTFIQLITVLIAVFLFSYSNLSKQDQYCCLVIKNKNDRGRYFCSKVLAIIVIIVVVFLLISLVLFIIGLTIAQVSFQMLSIVKLKNVLMVSIYYGLLSFILTQLTDSIYSSIITFACNILLTSLANDSEIIAVIGSCYNEHGLFDFPIVYIVLNISLLLTINLIIFFTKDLK